MDQDTGQHGIEGRVVGGRYRLIRRIDESTPERYEATHPRLTGRFEAKLWPPTAPWDDTVRRAAEIAATLRHRGVVHVIDFNCEPGEPPFLVTEWLEGTKLSNVMADTGLMSVARVAALVESAASALASAHERGVVHGALRPEDIYVVAAPGTGREWTKIDGIGVAGALAGSRTLSELSTSPYRAPETASPDGQPDPRADQFALAAIAYEMLSGVPPFDNAADGEPEPGEREVPSLLDLVPQATAAVDVVIRRALAAEPGARFPDVMDFARALRDAAAGANTSVVRMRSRRISERTRALARRAAALPGSVLVGIGLAATLTLLIVGAALLSERRRAESVAVAPVVAVAPAPRPAAPTPPAVVALPAPSPPAAQPTPEPALRPAAQQRGVKRTPAPVLATGRARPRPLAQPVALRSSPEPAAQGTGAGSGLCLLSVESTPRAQVWLDDLNTGQRTPLIAYRLPCGSHQLALKRGSLGIGRKETINVAPGLAFRKSYTLR